MKYTQHIYMYVDFIFDCVSPWFWQYLTNTQGELLRLPDRKDIPYYTTKPVLTKIQRYVKELWHCVEDL